MNTLKPHIENFLNDQTNLDVMTYLAKGEPSEKITKKIEIKPLFLESRINFIKKCGLISFGSWNVDVNALGMIKTFEFCDYNEEGWNKLFEKNFFLSYFSQIEIGKIKYLAMYTFPEEIKDKIGFEMSSWYYTFPSFKAPFFRNDFSKEKFLELYDEETNENPLPSRGEKIENPSLIDFYICRYVQLEVGATDLKKYAGRMKKEIGNIIDISYDEVIKHYQMLKEKNIIYRVSPLNFTNFSFVSFYCITSLRKVFKLMKTLNKFNILTGISFMRGKKSFLIIHCPHESRNTIIRIFDQLNRESEIYFITKIYENRGFPYKYYLEKFKVSQRNLAGR